MWVLAPLLRWVKTQKLQLCWNLACNCFTLLGNCLGIYCKGDAAPPTLLCSCLLLQETWTRFHPSLVTLPSMFVPLFWNFAHTFFTLSLACWHPQNDIFRDLDVRALLSLWGVQIHFWTFPIAFRLCRQFCKTYPHLFTRDLVHFNAFKVSTLCSVEVFH